MLNPNSIVEPVIKWSGSKRYVAPFLSKFISDKKRYFEPFVGGGSMLPFRKISNAVANDIIPELVNLWNQIKTNPEDVISEYKFRWERLQKEGHEVYYEIRNSFNATKNEHDFLFLTRTCVNGLIRYNADGKFNNSIHKNRPGINPKTFREIVLKWSKFIEHVHFFNQDYRTILSDTNKNDFVFLDPPYGGTKDRYTKIEFNISDFFNELEKLNSKGVMWILTFDGSAGAREYNYSLPPELFKNKTQIKTGNSPFTKLMKTNIDAIHESVYFNFNTSHKLTSDVQESFCQKLAFL